eukprot:2634690-Rhodomonas_salina.2
MPSRLLVVLLRPERNRDVGHGGYAMRSSVSDAVVHVRDRMDAIEHVRECLPPSCSVLTSSLHGRGCFADMLSTVHHVCCPERMRLDIISRRRQAFGVYDDMVELGLRPSVVTYTALISAAALQ